LAYERVGEHPHNVVIVGGVVEPRNPGGIGRARVGKRDETQDAGEQKKDGI